MDLELYNYLQQFLTTERKDKFASVIADRTRSITVVLENIYHRPNASAVIRTCECFGIQDIHFIDEFGFFKKANKKVVQGSAKWTTIHHYHEHKDNFKECIDKLKQEGYKIVATTLKDSYKQTTLEDIPVGDKKIALMLGTEETGLSKRAHEVADYYLSLPMYGFTTSFNISVTAAMCLSHFVAKLRNNFPTEYWSLSEKEKEIILDEWTKSSVKNVEALTRRFYQDKKQQK
ncbi:RNA methyltransferase [Lentisphaerota bacterium WC36G]|nr:RNA methyltransferase [Lentisphaerae bacterium WC36]